MWGGWLVVTGAVFSFMGGIVHPYYTVALAPAIAALVGIAVRELWRGREFLAPRIALAAMLASTGVWAFVLLDRTPDWLPALRWIVLAGSVVVRVGACGRRPSAGACRRRLAVGAMLFGAAARPYTLEPSRTRTADRWTTSGRPTAESAGPRAGRSWSGESDNANSRR